MIPFYIYEGFICRYLKDMNVYLFMSSYLSLAFSLLPGCLSAHPRVVHLTGDLKLSAATDNSLRAGIDEATGKLSVRMREKNAAGLRDTCRNFTYTCASHSRLFTWTREQVHTDDCAFGSFRLAGRTFLHILFTAVPFSHLSPPPFSLEGLTLCCGCVILPPLLQSQRRSKDESSSGSHTVHLPVGGWRQGGREREKTFAGVTPSFHTTADKKPSRYFLKGFFSPFLSTIEILIHGVFDWWHRSREKQFTPLGLAALFTGFGHRRILILFHFFISFRRTFISSSVCERAKQTK